MFLSKISASAAPADRSPGSDFWYSILGNYSNGSPRVTPDSSLQLSTVYRCVDLKSTSQAMLPFVLYRERKDGSKERIVDHPIYRLFSIRPNDFQNRFEWRQMMNAHLELRGNAYNQIVSNGKGEIEALLPLHPDRVKIELLDNGSHRFRYRDRNGVESILGRGQVWHLRALSLDGITGLSTIELARHSLSGAISVQEYGTRFWANDARPIGGWIEVPNSFKNDEEKRKFRESVQRAQGGGNRGKMMVLENQIKYHDVSVSNGDSQFLETKKASVTEIARWFGVPPHKVGDLEKASFSNIEQQALEFVMDCLQPMCVRLEAGIEGDLLFEDEGLKTEFDMTHLMRGDSAARAAYYHNGILDGWLVRNEARIAENYDPIPGLDAPLEPLNMGAVGTSLLGKPAAPAGKSQAVGEAMAARTNMLAKSAAERLTRKELQGIIGKTAEAQAEFYAKHADFIAAVLHIDIKVAQEYCASQLAITSSCDILVSDFETATQIKLENLALKGTL